MRLFIAFIIATTPLFGVMIPSYPIALVTEATVAFSNGTAFQVGIDGLYLISTWDVNDPIFFAPSPSPMKSAELSLQEAELRVRFPVSLINNAKGSQVIGYLQTEATMQTAGTRLVQTIQMGQRRIVLDDNSVWYFSSIEDTQIEGWQIGDFVVIGKSLFKDASLINVSRGTLILVDE